MHWQLVYSGAKPWIVSKPSLWQDCASEKHLLNTSPSDPPAGQHISKHALQRAIWANVFKKSILKT